MIPKIRLLPVILFVLLSFSLCSAQVIPSNRSVDWTHVGIPGGIPSASYPVCQTLSPSGGADDSAAIQTAINSCAAGSVVQLNPGTYTLHRSSVVCTGKSDDGSEGVYESGLCLTDKSIVLRGMGSTPAQTTLNYGDGANIISMGRTALSASSVKFINITAGSTQGSTQITLASTAGITVGTYLAITQLNPNDPADGALLVTTDGNDGNCTWCGHDIPTKVMDQVDRVTAISGATVTLERPLYYNYDTSPQAFVLSMVENVGLENLRVVGTKSSGATSTFKNINLESCAHCWVHDVESDMAVDYSHITMSDVYGSEISDNYVYAGFSNEPGETYSITPNYRVSETLIQNNIIRKARHSTPLVGSSGNVFGYNYAVDSFMQDYPNSLPETQGHGAHPYMNLFEGNVYPNVEFDFEHGSSGYQTVFRNYINMTSTNPSTNQPMTGALFAMAIAYYSNYYNILGNVIGAYPTGCTATTYQLNGSTNQGQNPAIYKIGYYDDGSTATPNATLSAKVENTMLRGGNWDCKTGTVVWNNNVPSGSLASSYLPSQTLPSSLYLSAAPSWFSAMGAVWPPVDPAAATKVNKIPAELCYQSGPLTGAAFNPATCYGAVVRPQPPSNLTAVVQ